MCVFVQISTSSPYVYVYEGKYVPIRHYIYDYKYKRDQLNNRTLFSARVPAFNSFHIYITFCKFISV